MGQVKEDVAERFPESEELVRMLLRSATVISNDKIQAGLRGAMASALKKHGRLTTDPTRAMTILTEEVGEVAEAVLITTRPSYKQMSEELKTELYQVGATVLWWLANLEGVDA